jgi:hypothetical protein
LLFEPIEHALRDQADATVRAPEASRVKIRILSHHKSLRDMHATVNDDLGQSGRWANLNSGQHHSFLQMGVGVDTSSGKQERAPQNGS